MEIRYTERKPSEQAADFARDNGLTIKRLQKSYCAFKDEKLIATGSSYGVLLNRMREHIGTLPVKTVDVSPSLVAPLKHISTEGPFRVSSSKISMENLPKVATGELLDHWLALLARPAWILQFTLDNSNASACFHNRSNAVRFSRSQANAARCAGRTYTSKGIRYA